MKVAIVVGSLANVGGLEKITVYLANNLSIKYNVDLIAFEKNTVNYHIDKNINLIETNIKYTIFEKILRKLLKLTFKSNRFSHYKEVNFLNNQIKNNEYDVIIASDGNQSMIVNDVLSKEKKYSDIKFISWMHNDYDIYFDNYFKNYKKELKNSLANSSYVVTLTNKNKKKYSIHNENTICIYNPITLNNFKMTTLKAKEIIFVARLVREQKGLDYLIEIAERIKNTNWKIRVVGTGKDKKWLEEEIFNKQLENTIILHGVVSENIEELYANASIFISTSRWEGFGLVITEAMSCGLPVIAFENSGPNEILLRGKYGFLIPKYNIDIFSETLLKLIEDKNLLVEYSNKSLSRINDFSMKNIIKQWEDIIESNKGKSDMFYK